MSEVLILSKTHMNGGKCCVGGITTKGRYVRLLDKNGENQPDDTDFKPRQIWNISFSERQHSVPPHVEDVIMISNEYKEDLKKGIKIKDYIEERKIPIWRGSPDFLFNGLLNWTKNGSGYIDKKNIPAHSVGFWISDENLTKKEFNGIRYNYPSSQEWRSIKYKGFEDPVTVIPKGTLIRVSLARWKAFEAGEEVKCWLQLSGWYDYVEPE